MSTQPGGTWARNGGPQDTPVYLRIGHSGEYLIGTIEAPEALPDLLRTAADYAQAQQQRSTAEPEEN